MKIQVNVSISHATELIATMHVVVGIGDTPCTVKDRVGLLQPLPFPEQSLVLDGKILDNGKKLHECGVEEGQSLDLVVEASEAVLVEQLQGLLQPRNLTCDELGLLYFYKYGISINQALKYVDYGESMQDFIFGQKSFVFENGRVSLLKQDTSPGTVAVQSPTTASVASGHQRYLDLHNTISSRTFHYNAVQAMNNLADFLMEVSFLNINRIVKGGAISKGTAISGDAHGELVCFLDGLPNYQCENFEMWLPLLLLSVANVLKEHIIKDNFVCILGVEVNDLSIKVSMAGLDAVSIFFSPNFESYGATIQELKKQGPAALRVYSASLVKERVQFMARQPGQVKVTARLLKWWKKQQTWSTETLCPTDELLELIAVYSSIRLQAQSQEEAVANAMSVMSTFNDLHVTWPNFYDEKDISESCSRRKPLLMDPANPFSNVADVESFDPQELIEYSKAAVFFPN